MPGKRARTTSPLPPPSTQTRPPTPHLPCRTACSGSRKEGPGPSRNRRRGSRRGSSTRYNAVLNQLQFLGDGKESAWGPALVAAWSSAERVALGFAGPRPQRTPPWLLHGSLGSEAKSPWRPHRTLESSPRASLEGKGPQRWPQQRLLRRLEEVAKVVWGGWRRLQMPPKPAFAVRETVAGRRLGALEGLRG